MKIAVFIPMILLCVSTQAQTAQEEINKQVWQVFIEGYNSFDTEKFMSVYAREVIRVPIDEQKVFNFTEYKRNINRENQFNKNYKIKASIELRFTERLANGDLAYEQGIYKISIIDNNGKPATIYSKFQVALKKEGGLWRIKYDTDTTEGGKVSEKDFSSAQPLKL
jgi:ketosteroid isomerase-like protein